MKYKHAFVALLAFLRGATIFTDAAAIHGGYSSFEALIV